MIHLRLTLGELDPLVVVDHERGAAVRGPGETLADFAVAIGGEIDFPHELPFDGTAVAAADNRLVCGALMGLHFGDDAHRLEIRWGVVMKDGENGQLSLNCFETRDGECSSDCSK